MKENKLINGQFNMINQTCPHICQNIKSESLQIHSDQNQENYYYKKFEDSKNQGKTPRSNHLNIGNEKQIKQQTLQEQLPSNVYTKKQTNSISDHLQLITENQQIEDRKNCQNQNSSNYLNQLKIDILNNNLGFQSRKINNNNQNGYTKINFQQTQKLKMQNQLLFIPQRENIQMQKVIQIVNKQELTMFIKGQQLIFPLPDHILKSTAQSVQNGQTKKNIKVRELPMGFCQMLELLNLSYLFPQKFILESETISRLNRILQATLFAKDHIQTKNLSQITVQMNELLTPTFTKYMKHLTSLLIQDLTSEKLQSLTNSFAYNVLSLAKFCQQNQLLQFVFEYNWPLITLELVKVHIDNIQDNLLSYNKSIILMKNHILNFLHQMPQSFQDKFHILSILIDCYSKTGSFRDLFNKKTQTTRNINKKKIILQEQKKCIELKIKKLISNSVKKQKKITKSTIKKAKNHNANHQQDSQNDQKMINIHTTSQQDDIQKLKERVEKINQEIEKENRQDSLSVCHYLGKDRFGQLYWYVTYFSDKLFIQKESVWGCVGIQSVQGILQGLQRRRGLQQSKLYQKIMEYYSSTLARQSERIQAQMQQQPNSLPLMYKSTNLFHSSSTLVEKNLTTNTSQQQKITSDNNENDLMMDQQQQQLLQNDSSKNSIQNNNQILLVGLGAFRVNKESLIKMIQVGEKKMTEYLKQRNSRWGSDENKHLLFSTLSSSQPMLSWLAQAKRQISLFNQKICVVEIQYKVFVQQSVQQVDSKVKKIQTKIWGINEKYKHNWYDFINNCNNFVELFYAVSVMYSLIKKYTSKQRKLRKQYEEVKLKSVWKTTPAMKQWKQQWNEQCQVCGSNGEVLCCDHCPKVYHLGCVNLATVPQIQFKCKSCKQQITTRNQFKLLSNSKKKQKC